MIFFTGFVLGCVLGAAVYRYLYTVQCSKNEVICNQQEKDREMQKQLERLITYGNDI